MINLVRLEDRLGEARQQLAELFAVAPNRKGVSVLADLVLRVEASSEIDGYATSDSVEGTRQPAGTHSDPTGNVVGQREDDICPFPRCFGGKMTLLDGRVVDCKTCGGSGRRWADPVADTVEAMITDLRLVIKAMKRVDAARQKVLTTTPKPERQGTLQGDCLACERPCSGTPNDRIKRGLCPDCYSSWWEWKQRNRSSDPGLDFHRFIPWRRGNLAREDADTQVAILQAQNVLPKRRAHL